MPLIGNIMKRMWAIPRNFEISIQIQVIDMLSSPTLQENVD